MKITTSKRVVTAKDIKRLVKSYEYAVQFLKGMHGMGSSWKAKAAKAKLATTNSEALFTQELAELQQNAREFDRNWGCITSITVDGDVLYISTTGTPRKLFNPSAAKLRPLTFLGIKTVTVGSEASSTDKHRGQADLTPAERLAQTLSIVSGEQGPAAAAHLAKVLAGEVDFMAPGPRGYATARNLVLGAEVRKYRKSEKALEGKFLAFANSGVKLGMIQ